jgi:hypothetical protein
LVTFPSAREKFAGLKNVAGFISEAAGLGEAEALQGLGKPGDAADVYHVSLKGNAVDAPAIWLSLANAELALAIGEPRPKRFSASIMNFP